MIALGMDRTRVLVFAGVIFGAVRPPAAAGETPPTAKKIAALRSVTYYKFGTKLQDIDIDLLAKDIAHAREVGFNGMWLIVPWRFLSPVALPRPRLHEPSWKKLDAMIGTLSREGFSIIFPLGYFGRGWSPKGIPAERLRGWIVDETIWGAFQEHVIRLTERYADRKSILWMFYTESFQGSVKAYEGSDLAKESFRRYCRRTDPDITYWNNRWRSDYASFEEIGMADGRAKAGVYRWEDHYRWMCSVLRGRYGGLTRRLKTEMRIQGLVGYHDNAMITKNWAKGDTPVPDANPYDFLSFTAYMGRGDIDARMEDVGAVYRRFRSLYPTEPLLIGETGVPTLVRDEATQARYLSRLAGFARQRSLGMNVWMWQDFKGSSKQQRSFGLLRLDGSEKPAVQALREAFGLGDPH